MDADIELNISFRFLALSDAQAEKLRASELEVTFGKHHKTSKNVGCVVLASGVIAHLSNFIVDNSVTEDEYDIFISFCTEYDTRIIDIPAYVNEAVKRLGSKLVLSYTII